MSGIAGIVQLDGAPVDRELLAEMAGALAFRGPDAQHVWAGTSVGFVHTLLKTTFEAEHEQQPASLDGQVWITADARIDGRRDLVRELGLLDSQLSRPDCELILHAYARWGEACVEHLIGDFAFAIWDGRERKLFCARDHFGVKPFYYARVGGAFVFSNTLNCVRLHPAVSSELNELAIADFLIFGFNQEPATTTFQAIQRLPAAHVLVIGAVRVLARRYWCLPDGETLRYSHARDYVEHFQALLETACTDRIRTTRIRISMSGGLDSSSVAAFTRKVSPETQINAFTWVSDWLIPDDERYFAGLVASALNIPIDFLPIDHIRPFESSRFCMDPEPVHNPFGTFEPKTTVSNTVTLTGHGADPLFCISPMLNWASLRSVPLLDTVVNFIHYNATMKRVPRFRLRSTFFHLVGRTRKFSAVVPAWINKELATRCDLPNRVTAIDSRVPNSGKRSLARKSLQSLFWTDSMEKRDLDFEGETRHPYFDLRLMRFLLAIPELPYTMDKWLLRLALQGLLPEEVRSRPKTPVRIDQLLSAFKEYGLPPATPPHSALDQFVDRNAIPLIVPNCSAEQIWTDTKPTSFNDWLNFQENLCLISKNKITRKPDCPINSPSFVFMAPLQS